MSHKIQDNSKFCEGERMPKMDVDIIKECDSHDDIEIKSRAFVASFAEVWIMGSRVSM